MGIFSCISVTDQDCSCQSESVAYFTATRTQTPLTTPMTLLRKEVLSFCSQNNTSSQGASTGFKSKQKPRIMHAVKYKTTGVQKKSTVMLQSGVPVITSFQRKEITHHFHKISHHGYHLHVVFFVLCLYFKRTNSSYEDNLDRLVSADLNLNLSCTKLQTFFD